MMTLLIAGGRSSLLEHVPTSARRILDLGN